MDVGHALAIAEIERFQLAGVEDLLQLIVWESSEPRAHVWLGRIGAAECVSMVVRDAEELREVPRRIRAAANGQEIDDLNEEPRLTAARLADHAHEVTQAGQKAVVADSKQWPARHVADARRLDNNRARTPAGETFAPVKNVGRYEPIVTRSPGDHGGHPGALDQFDRANFHRREQA